MLAAQPAADQDVAGVRTGAEHCSSRRSGGQARLLEIQVALNLAHHVGLQAALVAQPEDGVGILHEGAFDAGSLVAALAQ